MAALDHRAGLVLGQVDVDCKTNEIRLFSVLLDTIADLTGVVVTADAMHAQRGHAQYLQARCAHYMLTVKGNQKKLRSRLATLPWKDVPIGYHESEISHGRRVTRTYTIEAGILFP